MPREKIKFAMRNKPETQQLVSELYQKDNCRSQNEFIEKAIQFYAGYLKSGSAVEYLIPMLTTVLHGIVQDSENRIARLLFKLAVEVDMMMNVLAYAVEITPEQLQELRPRCIQEVKKTGGRITFDDAVAYQNRL